MITKVQLKEVLLQHINSPHIYAMPSLGKYPKPKDKFILVSLLGKSIEVSIQANEYTYCQPRNNIGPYTHVELGYPNFNSTILKPYAEDPDNLQSTVYGQVPVEVVLEVLWKEING